MASILEDYHTRVASQILVPDDAQLDVARRLDRLSIELSGYRPVVRERGWKRVFGNPASGEPPRGLYVWGGVGRGKTMLMDLFHERAPLAKKRRVHFHRFMQEVHQALHIFRQKQRSGHVWEDASPIAVVSEGIAENTALLCFDEFQVTDITDAMILGRLFEALFGLGVVIVATSNTPPRDLYRNGLNRDAFLPFIVMLESKLEVVHLDGPRDYRLDRIAGEQRYVSPLGPDADRRIERLWRELTEGAEERTRSLPVAGRAIKVARAAGGVARFSFSELCEQPFGARDYMAIAEAFHTVIVTGLPHLPKSRHNEARRLTILVDTLYDRGVRLIVSAQTQPQGLYAAAGSSVEFARTVSRLHEMGSQSYWQGRRAAGEAGEAGSDAAPWSLAANTHPG